MVNCFSLKLINIEHNKMLLLTTEDKNHRKIVKYVTYEKEFIHKDKNYRKVESHYLFTGQIEMHFTVTEDKLYKQKFPSFCTTDLFTIFS